jgi:phosphatidylglycerophosphate synthase
MGENGKPVLKVRTGVAVGVGLAAAILLIVALTVGLHVPGLLVGITFAAVIGIVVGRARRDDGSRRMGPADVVTLVRAVLAGVVAALVADSFVGPISVPLLVGLSVAALVLDRIDGLVARRTGTVSEFGARFDMEVDSFLILALSVYVARDYGGWVLAIGAARYLFWVAGRLWPWMSAQAAPLPPRYWRKVVAATQGIVLTVAAADVLPHGLTEIALVAAAVLLVESFGRDIWWTWRHREEHPSAELAGSPDAALPGAGPVRRVIAAVVTVLAFVVVWMALTAPDQPDQLTLGGFLRIPIEGLILVVIVLVVPPRWARVIAVVSGAVLAILALFAVLDLGFGVALDRPFDPVTDWAYLGPAFGVLGDSLGQAGAVVVTVVAAGLVLAVLVAIPLAARRVAVVAGRHRVGAARVIGGVGVVWVACAALGLQLTPGAPVASASASGLAYTQVRQIRTDVTDQQDFVGSIGRDPMAITPTRDLLTGLRGKDVLIVFVESYGKVALTDPLIAPGVDGVLGSATTSLQSAGFSARSGYLTSPTFGGISWLAHSTLQSGLWIDSQLRYNELIASDRFTLSDAFRDAGWRTVGDVPSNFEAWPEGTSFYHYDQIYDAHNVGYDGPQFSYSQMPDQYILSALQRLELAKTNRPPVMAEIDLVSSHTPWAPLPTMVNWAAIGDGSVYNGMPEAGASPTDVWSTNDGIVKAYGQSIQYSLTALTSFVTQYPDPNLVMVVLGDHQPATVVSGQNPSHDVPISIIAHDPAVLDDIASWGWSSGLRPAADAPVWPMSDFRNKFLTAFGA